MASRTSDMVALDEVEALIQQRVDAALERITASHSGMDSGSKALAQNIVAGLAEMNDQGTGRVRVTPQEMEKRDAARARMYDLLGKALHLPSGEAPAYTLQTKIFVGFQLIEPKWREPLPPHLMRDTVIEFRDVPCEPMIPANDAARAIYDAFRESIGDPEDGMAVSTEVNYKFTASALGMMAVLQGPQNVKEAQQTGNEERRMNDEYRSQLMSVKILTGDPKNLAAPVTGQDILGTIHSKTEYQP